MRQGYLSFEPEIRVRTVTDASGLSATLTYKGSGQLARTEVEVHLAYQEALRLLEHVQGAVITKTRSLWTSPDGFIWEIDQYAGQLQGLWVAEIELSSEDQPFQRPLFLAKEITFDSAFKNRKLAELAPRLQDLLSDAS